jgi:hypothetical protein
MSSSLSIEQPTKSFQFLNEHLKDKKYKTEMCKNWEKNGFCPYNSKCRFAHGRDELIAKEIESNPNYKAKDCLNFFKFSFCSYGRRCCFRHDERRLSDQSQISDFKILIRLNNPDTQQSTSRLSVFSELTKEKEEEKQGNTYEKRRFMSRRTTTSNTSTSSSSSSYSSGSYSKNSIYNNMKMEVNKRKLIETGMGIDGNQTIEVFDFSSSKYNTLVF